MIWNHRIEKVILWHSSNLNTKVIPTADCVLCCISVYSVYTHFCVYQVCSTYLICWVLSTMYMYESSEHVTRLCTRGTKSESVTSVMMIAMILIGFERESFCVNPPWSKYSALCRYNAPKWFVAGTLESPIVSL